MRDWKRLETGDWETKRLGVWETSDFPVFSFRAKREIFVIRGEGLTLPPMRRALFRFPHLSFIPPVPYPPLRGTFPSSGDTREACHRKSSGIAPYIFAAKPPP